MIRVTAAVMQRGNRVLIARRAQGGHLAGLWEFPGGKIEDGETPEQCLVRELREEFAIETETVEFLEAAVHHYAEKSIELLAFRVRIVSGEFVLDSHDEIQWVPPAEFANYSFAPADDFIVQRLLREQSA